MFRWLKELWEKGAPKPPAAPAEDAPRAEPDAPPAEREPSPSQPSRRTSVPRRVATPRERAHAPGRSQPTGFDWRSYDPVAEEYERVHAGYTSAPVRDLLTGARATPGMRVLDVGTGTAIAVEITQDAVGPSGLAVGVDPAARMLEVAHAERPGLALAAAEVLDLPFLDESFDLVVANFALPYFRKLDTSLFEMKRVLKPGGLLAVSMYSTHEDDLTRTWRLLCEEAVSRDVLKAGIKEEMPWGQKLGDPKRLEQTLRDDGFRPVKVEKRKYRLEIPREDYIVGHEIEASGRYVRKMLGPQLWERFRERARARYAERFPETLLDFRDVLLAFATKP